MQCLTCKGSGHFGNKNCRACKGAGWVCNDCRAPIWDTEELRSGICQGCYDTDEESMDEYNRHPDEEVNAGKGIHGD